MAVQEPAGVAWAELTSEVLIKKCLIQTSERHTSFCLYALCNTNYFSKSKIKPMLFETLMSVYVAACLYHNIKWGLIQDILDSILDIFVNIKKNKNFGFFHWVSDGYSVHCD